MRKYKDWLCFKPAFLICYTFLCLSRKAKCRRGGATSKSEDPNRCTCPGMPAEVARVSVGPSYRRLLAPTDIGRGCSWMTTSSMFATSITMQPCPRRTLVYEEHTSEAKTRRQKRAPEEPDVFQCLSCCTFDIVRHGSIMSGTKSTPATNEPRDMGAELLLLSEFKHRDHT